jgi:hypothetical protein
MRVAGQSFLRWLPTCLGLCAFAVMTFLYASDRQLYLETLRIAGIRPWNFAFIDSEYVYAVKRCWELGYDIYSSIPCYELPLHFPYSPLWPRIPFLPDDKDAARIPIGLTTDILFILSIATLPPARSWRGALLMSMALISTAVFFALERNNVDVWIFLTIILGGHLLNRHDAARWMAYPIFLVAGLLKYYPITLLGLGLRERPRQTLAIFLLAICSVSVFGFYYFPEIAKSVGNVPEGSPFGDLVGIKNLPRAVAIMASTFTAHPGRPDPIITFVLYWTVVALVCLGGARLSGQPGFATAWSTSQEVERSWLVIGSVVMCGCYLAGENISYRLIYLLIVLPGILALYRAAKDSRLRRKMAAASILIVCAMWMEGIRHWTDLASRRLGFGQTFGNEAVSIVWMLREAAWLYLAATMLAVLFTFIRQSTCNQSFLEYTFIHGDSGSAPRDCFPKGEKSTDGSSR